MDLLEQILLTSAKGGASDIFLTAGKAPSVRKNGTLVTGGGAVVPGSVLDAFRQRLLGQTGEAEYRLTGARDASGTFGGSRFRFNFYETVEGPALAARPLKRGGDAHASELNLPGIVEKLCCDPRGLVLIAGSTGSGKSTTLAAMVNYLNRNFSKHILTLEDPVEYLHDDIRSLVSQREIRSDTESCANALRAALRENPDVIVIGEIRDTETVRAAMGAALTGHLVLATIHTADTVQTVERVINMFPGEQRERSAADLGLALNAVLAQRLLPRADGNGMIPAFEIMTGTPSVRKLIAERDYGGLEDAVRRGAAVDMIPFDRAIFRLCKSGHVTLEDARAAVSSKEEFELLVRGMESGVDSFRNHYGGDSEEGECVDMRSLLRAAMRNGASDLILSAGTSPTLRINGMLRALDLPGMTERDIRRLLHSVITQRQRIEFEEKRELDFALSVNLKQDDGTEKQCRFRLNGFYQRGTVGAVARVVNLVIPPPEALCIPPAVLGLIEKRQGLILVTGPTGSGKSTTLASLIDRINRSRPAHIITIEDPIEYVHGNIQSIVEQRELHADTMSFSTALKYALRQNPDVIMVGEMRDVETMAAALTAAETGHLVLATIHTNSAPQTVDRIVDSFPVAHQNQIRLQLASVLLGVISQRLLPGRNGGRAAAFEVMIGTPPVQANIREGKTHQLQSVIETGGKDGMITLEKALERLYDQGLVTLDEIKRFKVDCKQVASYV